MQGPVHTLYSSTDLGFRRRGPKNHEPTTPNKGNLKYDHLRTRNGNQDPRSMRGRTGLMTAGSCVRTPVQSGRDAELSTTLGRLIDKEILEAIWL